MEYFQEELEKLEKEEAHHCEDCYCLLPTTEDWLYYNDEEKPICSNCATYYV